MSRPPLPPFTETTAAQKVRAAEDGWNSRSPQLVTQAYTDDSKWRNRSEFLSGHAEIEAFLPRKWQREHHYRLIKELWAWTENRIAVRFAYEWCDEAGHWSRSYGNENWEFATDGRMCRRMRQHQRFAHSGSVASVSLALRPSPREPSGADRDGSLILQSRQRSLPKHAQVFENTEEGELTGAGQLLLARATASRSHAWFRPKRPAG